MVMCNRLIRKVPLFHNRDEHFINAVLLKLEYEIFLEGDIIVRQNVPGDRMFFIDHGQVLLETDSGERELNDGDFFGGETLSDTFGKSFPGLTSLLALSTGNKKKKKLTKY